MVDCEQYRKKIIVNCSFCNEELKRRPTHTGNAFCDIYCQNAYRRGWALDDEFKKQVISMHEDEGWTYRQLTEYFECNMSLIYRILKGEI